MIKLTYSEHLWRRSKQILNNLRSREKGHVGYLQISQYVFSFKLEDYSYQSRKGERCFQEKEVITVASQLLKFQYEIIKE